MVDSNSKSDSERLKKARIADRQSISELQSERMKLLAKIQQEYPPFPHDNITAQEIQDTNLYHALSQRIVESLDQYTAAALDSLDIYLESIASDSKWIKRLTVALVVLTIILTGASIADILVRIGYLK